MRLAIFWTAALLPMFAAAATTDIIVQGGDVDGLRAALEARDPKDPHRTIKVCKGVFRLDSPLRIFPNTTLSLEADTTIEANYTNVVDILRGGHYADDGSVCPGQEGQEGQGGCRHGGYGQTHDVVVEGGVWNRKSPDDVVTSVFVFRHSSRIAIRGMRIQNCSGHYINCSGSQNVSVSDVVFEKPVKYTAPDPSFWGTFAVGDPLRYQTVEAIHTDFINEEGEPSVVPLDGTGCRNISVERCLFNGVFSGVGTHHVNAQRKGDGLFVTDCVFSNLLSWAVFSFSFDSVQIENCQVVGGAGLLTAVDSDIYLGGNASLKGTDHAVRVENSVLVAENNAISRCAGNAFHAVSSKATLEDNEIVSSSNVGIRGSEGTTLEANRNRISDAGLHGISVSENTVLDASDNIVERPKQTCLIANGATVKSLVGNTFDHAGASAVCGLEAASITMSGNKIVAPAEQGIVVTGRSELTASGNTVDSARTNGIRIEESTATLSRNTIDRVGAAGIRVDSSTVVASSNTIRSPGTYGIRANNDSKVTASSNTIDSSASHGILVDGCQPSSFTKNKIAGAKECGIRIIKSKGCTVSDNTVSGTGASSDGIVLDGCASGTVSGNQIDSAGANGIRLDGSAATLSRNAIDRAGAAGIRVDSSTAVADSNTIRSPGSYGIRANNGSKVTATSNTIDSSASHAVLVDGCQPSSFSRNKIAGSKQCGIRILKSKGCTVSGNTISGTGAKSDGIVLDGCATGTVSGNNVSGASGHGIRVVGSKQTPATVTIKGNTVASSGAAGYADIRLGDYCKKCKVTENILANKKFSMSSTGCSGTIYAPPTVQLTSALRTTSQKATVNWARNDFVDGYQLQYADNKSFKKAKTKKIKKAKTVSATIASLTAKKRYFVRIRTFDKLAKKTSYSAWSTVCPVLHVWASGDFGGYALVNNTPCQADLSVSANGRISGRLVGKGIDIPFAASGFASFNNAKQFYKASIPVVVGQKKQTCSFKVQPIPGDETIGRMKATGTGVNADLSSQSGLFSSKLKKMARSRKTFKKADKDSGLAANQSLQVAFSANDTVSIVLNPGNTVFASGIRFYKASKSGSKNLYYGQIPIISPDAKFYRLLKCTITRKKNGSCSVKYAFSGF